MKILNFATIITIMSVILAGCGQEANQPAGSDANEANDFPTENINLVVPFAAGGGTDSVARALAKSAEKYLPNGESFVVENITGASGALGTQNVLNAEPDGLTLGFVTDSRLTLETHLDDTAYQFDDFEPILRVSTFPQGFAVHTDSDFETFEEWVSYAKENPGELSVGTLGPGSLNELAVNAVNSQAGIETKLVPHDGAAESQTALLGGHIDGIIIPPEVGENNDDIQQLMVIGNENIIPEYAEDIPTADELGYELNSFGVSLVVVAPKGLPSDVSEILHETFKKALEDPEFVQHMDNINMSIDYAGPDKSMDALVESHGVIGDLLDDMDLNQ